MIDVNSQKKYAIALGCFDGLHTAHISVINEAVKAREDGFCPAVMLFDEHPKSVLTGKKSEGLLQTAKRNKILSDMGVEVFTVSFFQIKDMSPEEFVRKILAEKFNAGVVCCGYNFRFGKNAEGDSEMLKEICAAFGIRTVICPKIQVDSEDVSSTKIRNAVKTGEIERANRMSGFPYSFCSEVFTGDKRGRLLGAPTINQFIPSELCVPAFGVYASRVYFDDKMYIGVTNIGSRPTFDGESVRSETYIVGFEGDLYGREVTVELYKFLREERKFPDADTLKAQISRDVTAAVEYFSAKCEKNKKN